MTLSVAHNRTTQVLAIMSVAWLFSMTAWATTGAAPDMPTKGVSVGSLRGILRPVRDLSLPAQAAGIVEKYGAAEGSSVSAGALLVQLEADVERAEVANAEAAVDRANAELERAQRELERTTILRNDSIGSKKDFEDSQLARAVAEAVRKQALAALDTARAHLAERSITAPFAGMLYKRTREVGEAVERLEPVVRLVDATKLVVVIYAGAELLGKFTVGQKTHIVIDSGPARGTQPEATVSYVDPIMDPETGTFRIKLEVALSDTIQPGMSATLQLPAELN